MLEIFNSNRPSEELFMEFKNKLIYENAKRLILFLGLIGFSQILFIIFEVFNGLPWEYELFIIRISLIVFCSLSAGALYFLGRIKGDRKAMLAVSILTASIHFISVLAGCYFVTYMFSTGIYSYSAFYLVIFIITLIYIRHPYSSSVIMMISLICTTIYLGILYSPISAWLGEFLIALVVVPILCVFSIINYKRYLKQFLQEREMEKKVSLMASKLSQKHKLESIGTLASGIAHEINNPINGVLNYGQIILDSAPDDKNIKVYAKEIITETERIAVIVRDLLDFSKQNHLEKEYTRIEDIISGTLSLINVIIKRDEITLNVNTAKNIPKIKCRSQQIQQVLMNLVSNARDALNEAYSEYDENKVININCMQYTLNKRKWVRLIVEDFGGGISKDSMTKIFDPFYSTKGRFKGTGLGLSISYVIIKEHNGEIAVESEEGRFTRFIISLPCDSG